MGRDDWVSFVTYLSGYLRLIVSEVSNSANRRSFMVKKKKMILDHGSANALCLVMMQLIIALWILTNFTSICKFVSTFLITSVCVCLCAELYFELIIFNFLLVPSSVKDVNKISDMCSLYFCMRFMMILSFTNFVNIFM